jgi:hypothetical protein
VFAPLELVFELLEHGAGVDLKRCAGPDDHVNHESSPAHW